MNTPTLEQLRTKQGDLHQRLIGEDWLVGCADWDDRNEYNVRLYIERRATR